MRCDSHVHVIGPIERYPQVPTRTYLSMPAPVKDLQRAGAPRGVSRFVIVQPSFYGTDNTMTVEALEALGPDGRGVVVIDPANTPREELDRFAKYGVRGVRINLYSPLGQTGSLAENFSALTGVARAMGWHVQVIAPIKMLVATSDLLAASPVPVVIDHYGVHGASRPDSPEGRKLLDLVRQPHVWVKLSGPYRNSENPLETKPDRAWLSAILGVAEERCVWGSDWPHTPAHAVQKGRDVPEPHRKLDYGQLVDDFLAALGDAGLAEEIMTNNPARLYAF